VGEILRLGWRVFWLWYRRPAHLRRHRELLARIDRLERELFPDWFPKEPSWKYSLAPGAVWHVDHPAQVMALNSLAARRRALRRGRKA
jgi:hypothetical protein